MLGRLHGSSINRSAPFPDRDAASTSFRARWSGRSNTMDPSLHTTTFPSFPDPNPLQTRVTSVGDRGVALPEGLTTLMVRSDGLAERSDAVGGWNGE